MKVTLTPYTRRHFTCKAATFLTPAQISDLHELGHCESKSVKKMATSPFDIHVAGSSVVFMIHAANWHARTHTHAGLMAIFTDEPGLACSPWLSHFIHLLSPIVCSLSSSVTGSDGNRIYVRWNIFVQMKTNSFHWYFPETDSSD